MVSSILKHIFRSLMGHHFEGFDVEHNTSSNQFKYQRFVAKKFSAILAVAMKWVQNHVQQLQLGYCFLMGMKTQCAI